LSIVFEITVGEFIVVDSPGFAVGKKQIYVVFLSKRLAIFFYPKRNR